MEGEGAYSWKIFTCDFFILIERNIKGIHFFQPVTKTLDKAHIYTFQNPLSYLWKWLFKHSSIKTPPSLLLKLLEKLINLVKVMMLDHVAKITILTLTFYMTFCILTTKLWFLCLLSFIIQMLFCTYIWKGRRKNGNIKLPFYLCKAFGVIHKWRHLRGGNKKMVIWSGFQYKIEVGMKGGQKFENWVTSFMVGPLVWKKNQRHILQFWVLNINTILDSWVRS